MQQRRLASDRETKTARIKTWVQVFLAVFLVFVTWLLFPGPLESGPGAPRNFRSVEQSSVAAIYTSPYGGTGFSSNLSWNWEISGGRSEATLSARIQSSEARGSLVLGGPITKLVTGCVVNGTQQEAAIGLSDAMGFAPPHNATFWFGGRSDGSIAHFDFPAPGVSGETVIVCTVRDFGSDQPPVHRLYTPTLLSYSEGMERASTEDLEKNPVCVEVLTSSRTRAESECAENFTQVPLLFQSEQLITVPEEQWYRDALLLALGAAAGAAVASVLELATRVMTSLVRGSARVLRRMSRKWKLK